MTQMGIRAIGAIVLQACWLSAPATSDAPRSGGPKPETEQAFSRYVRHAESLLDARLRGEEDFLWAGSEELRTKLRAGSLVCEPRNERGDVNVEAGLIHDWMGAVFIPGVKVGDVLRVVQDYDNHKNTYPHEVMNSRTLEHDGNNYRVYLRLLKRKVITVVLDTEHEVRYRKLDAHRWHSRSYSTKIVEVDNPGTPEERPMPPRNSHGFLWRLNSYWTFQERDGGVYVECEAISLSRNVPLGLGWLLHPIVRNLPREALAGTLEATRDALRRPR